MGRKPRSKTPSSIALGRHLALLRKASGMSLREVEKDTGREVDDAYLSQIENGWVQFPHPRILQRLAKLYKADYHQMLLIAYPHEGGTGKRLEMFTLEGLTKDELLACQSFLQHFRATERRS